MAAGRIAIRIDGDVSNGIPCGNATLTIEEARLPKARTIGCDGCLYPEPMDVER